eukprot:209601-Pelagomonas_calceolata.AAC.2
MDEQMGCASAAHHGMQCTCGAMYFYAPHTLLPQTGPASSNAFPSQPPQQLTELLLAEYFAATVATTLL